MNEKMQIRQAKQAIAGEIKIYRKLRAVTFLDLARRSGISKGTLSKIENGIGNPTIETLSRISFVLGMELKIEVHTK